MPHFVQVPPDSTGKKISHSVEVTIPYSGLVIPFLVGDLVSGATSGIIGSVTRVDVNGPTIGEVLIMLSDDSETSSVTIGENLLVSGSIKAVSAGAATQSYIARSVLASGDNPHNVAQVTRTGALVVQATGGDAFGRSQVSETNRLAEYTFHDDRANEFQTVLVNGGTTIHHPEFSGMVLQVPTTSGAKAQMTSHQYHRYQAGLSQLIIMTAACGDVGKTGLVRRWGYYDDNDGIFFQQANGILSVVVRSSTSGSPVDTVIPQHEWNTNRINGEVGPFNITGYDLDITMDSIWWIDMQWLGAGTVRFGIYHDGERLTCHEEHHDGRLPVSYMRTGSLPVRWEVYNTSTTASTSEFTIFCPTVQCEGKFSPEVIPFGRIHVGVETITSDTVPQVISSMRMKQTYKGQPNRGVAIPQNFSVFSQSAPAVFEIVKNATLSDFDSGELGGAWARDPGANSAVEFDYAYRACSGGEVIISRIIAPNITTDINLTQQFGINGERVKRHANIAEYDTYSFRMRLLKPGSSDVFIALEWGEIR